MGPKTHVKKLGNNSKINKQLTFFLITNPIMIFTKNSFCDISFHISEDGGIEKNWCYDLP